MPAAATDDDALASAFGGDAAGAGAGAAAAAPASASAGGSSADLRPGVSLICAKSAMPSAHTYVSSSTFFFLQSSTMSCAVSGPRCFTGSAASELSTSR